MSQYERMQDIVVSYSILIIKFLGIVSGGALVTIGTSYISLGTKISGLSNPLQNTLAESFSVFCIAMVLILLGLAILYFSRLAYLLSCDEGRYNSEKRQNFERCGDILEYTAVFIYLGVFALICYGFLILVSGFDL